MDTLTAPTVDHVRIAPRKIERVGQPCRHITNLPAQYTGQPIARIERNGKTAWIGFGPAEDHHWWGVDLSA